MGEFSHAVNDFGSRNATENLLHERHENKT